MGSINKINCSFSRCNCCLKWLISLELSKIAKVMGSTKVVRMQMTSCISQNSCRFHGIIVRLVCSAEIIISILNRKERHNNNYNIRNSQIKIILIIILIVAFLGYNDKKMTPPTLIILMVISVTVNIWQLLFHHSQECIQIKSYNPSLHNV